MKLLYKLDIENEIIIHAELLDELQIKSYEKKLGRFTDETKNVREILNEKFEVLIDLENLRLLERVDSDFEAESTLNGKKPIGIYKLIKVFNRDGALDFTRQNIFDKSLGEDNTLRFIVEII